MPRNKEVSARARRGELRSESQPPGSTLGTRLLICCILVVAILAVYASLAGSAFINYDDDLYVSQNPIVQRGLTLDGLAWAFSSVSLYYWQPLTWLSHMLDCQLFGLNPGPHHMVSVMFHVFNALVLFLLLDRITGRLWPAAVTAALFALHPLRVESVAWIAERKDVLSGFFFLLTLWAYWRYTRTTSGRRYALLCAAFALALMSKPTVVTLPILLLLLDYWPLGRLESRPLLILRIREKLPLIGMSAVASAVTYFGQQQFRAVSSPAWSLRLANVASAYVRYLQLTFVPRRLAILYPYRTDYRLWEVTGCVLLLVAITWAVVAPGRRRPFLATGWFWFIAGLLPTIGLVQAGTQALADRFTYLPSIGLLMLLVWGLSDASSRWKHRQLWLSGIAVLILPIIAGISAAQVRAWKDGVTVFTRAAEYSSEDALIQHNLGYALAAAGHPDQALAHYRKALLLQPDNFRVHYNLGRALVNTGNPGEAIPHFEQVLRLNPEPDFASDTHNALAILLVRDGRINGAEPHFREALRLKPDSPELHSNLGSLLAQKPDLEGALAEFSAAIRLNPGYAEAHKNRGLALLQLGRRKDALAEFIRTLELAPDDRAIERQIELLQQK